MCDGCHALIGERVRYKCLQCPAFDLCADCEDAADVFGAHGGGTHVFAKIRSTRSVGAARVAGYARECARCGAGPCSCHLLVRSYDAYGFHKASCEFRGDAHRAAGLALVQRMLRVENGYRLSPEVRPCAPL